MNYIKTIMQPLFIFGAVVACIAGWLAVSIELPTHFVLFYMLCGTVSMAWSAFVEYAKKHGL